MTHPSAFDCTFSDWKLIKTRGVVSISFEVPIEKADAAYKVLGGMPDHGTERWFGIARLDPKALEPPKPKRSWHEMQPAQQAGILCEDKVFHQFLRETTDYTHADYPLMVRQICGIESRADILPGTNAAEKWRSLVSDYRAWNMGPGAVG